MNEKKYLALRNDLQLQKVVNAAGRMTTLGGSVVSKKIATMLFYGAQDFVVMKDLVLHTARRVAKHFEVGLAHITSSATTAIWQVVAALIHRGRDKYIFSPIRAVQADDIANKIIIPKGHNINYGVRMETVLEIAGANVEEAGSANICSAREVETLIDAQTIALIYVKSHHCIHKAMLSYEEMIALGQKHGIPVIIDASAEEDIAPLLKGGANIVIWSTSKAMAGPSGGIIVGDKQIIDWVRSGAKGIDRIAKVDKALVFAIAQAFDDYFTNPKPDLMENAYNYVFKKLQLIESLHIQVTTDQERTNIKRLRVALREGSPLTIAELIAKLQSGDVAIYTRNYHQNQGHIDIDLRMFKPGDERLLVTKFEAIFNEKRSTNNEV